MKQLKLVPFAVAGLFLGGCADGFGDGLPADKTIDRGTDRKNLIQLQAGIWVDPNGCDHWIIDDGVEGYLSARLDKYGKPVCSGIAPPTQTVGDFKGGSRVNDPN